MAQVYGIDATDPVKFKRALLEKLSKEPKLNDITLKQYVDKASGDVPKIEEMIARNVVESGMEAMREGAFFEVTDIRSMANQKETKTTGLSLRTATAAYTGNWELHKITDSGRYGAFVEKYFFGGGAGNEAKADLQLDNGTEIELKTTMHKYGKALTANFTAGKMAGDFARAWENLKSLDEQEEFLQGLVYIKYLKKMQNLLVAGVSKLPDEGAVKWIPTKDGWEETTQKFFFDKLFYFFQLLAEFLVKIVQEQVVVKKDIVPSGDGKTTIGGLIEVRKKEGEIERFEVKIKATHLPDLGGLQDIVVENADKLYAGKLILFDDMSPDVEKQSKAFFDRILKQIGH